MGIRRLVLASNLVGDLQPLQFACLQPPRAMPPKRAARQWRRVRFDDEADGPAVAEGAWPDNAPDSDSSSGVRSAPSDMENVEGDSVVTLSDTETTLDKAAVAERQQERVSAAAFPETPFQGDPAEQKKHSRWNNEAEVGNFGLFFGNWGQRGTLGGGTKSNSDVAESMTARSSRPLLRSSSFAKPRCKWRKCSGEAQTTLTSKHTWHPQPQSRRAARTRGWRRMTNRSRG